MVDPSSGLVLSKMPTSWRCHTWHLKITRMLPSNQAEAEDKGDSSDGQNQSSFAVSSTQDNTRRKKKSNFHQGVGGGDRRSTISSRQRRLWRPLRSGTREAFPSTDDSATYDTKLFLNRINCPDSSFNSTLKHESMKA